ncbi:MAG: MlaD family protein [candidate division Zixibacteria bacterium]|jgi:phospholipid/cholesterol/gamma-HCH transport system substrate-binding protein|nr:MlaD family protein [candidate division Zixibacteria bacterium]
MKRSIHVGWGNLKTGILLLVATVLLFWASFTGGGSSIFQPKNEFVAFFGNVNGLLPGAPVWMSGVEVGNVKSVQFVNISPDKQVRLVCRVEESVWHMVTEDATVHLGTIGFLGDKYVEVVPGSKDKPVIADGDTLTTVPVADASALFESGERAFDNVGGLVNNLDTLLGRMNAGEGTLGKLATDAELYRNMTALLANLTKLTADLQRNQERIVSSIEKTGDALERVSVQATENTGTLGRMMNDPKLYDNLAATSARLDTIMTYIQNAEGSLGLLVQDTGLYIEMVNLLHRTNNLVADIERNPRKYLKFSVF